MSEKRYVSSMDVARLAGVSQSAVSRTYTPGASVSPATRERVLSAARTLGYRPNLLPQALMSHRSRLVAVAVGAITNPFYASVLEQFTAALLKAGQQVVLIQIESDNGLDAVLNRIAGYRVDALVSALAVLSHEVARALSALRIPVVCFNGRIHAKWVSSVSLDNLRAGELAAEHLCKVGGQNFAFLDGPSNSPAAADRRLGFARRLRRLRRRAPLVLSGDYSYEAGLTAASHLVATTPRPDAIACANDLSAFGLIDGLRRAGLDSPRDIRVLGYDNIGMCAWGAYELTSFDQNVPEMIRLTLRLLFDDTAVAEMRQGVLQFVPACLVVRRTTGGLEMPGEIPVGPSRRGHLPVSGAQPRRGP
jgi:DNA-binding LacI/PurR family transcriptional regulator